MQPPQLIVASPNQSRAKAIAQTVSIAVPNSALPHQVIPVCFRNRQQLIQALSAELNYDVVALIDLSDASIWEPWDVGSGHQLGLAAELTLSFPEVYFIFLGNGDKAWNQFERYMFAPTAGRLAGDSQEQVEGSVADEDDSQCRNQVHGIRQHHFVSVERLLPDLLTRLAWHHDGFRTLFDATTIRNVVKRKIVDSRTDLSSAHASDFNSRITSAASSIDEESSFLYLNAYVAYKAGFSTWLCSSAAETMRVHNLNDDRDQSGLGALELVITDFELQFPDLRGSDAYSPTAATSQHLFSVESPSREAISTLNNNSVPSELQQAFVDHHITLMRDVKVQAASEGNEWTIRSTGMTFVVNHQRGKLIIRKSMLIDRVKQLGDGNAALSFYVITGDRNATKEIFRDKIRHAIVDKPYEGIFHLLPPPNSGADFASLILAERYAALREERSKNAGGLTHQSRADDGGTRTSSLAGRQLPDTHSVPFAIKTITDRLLDRARAMMRLENPPVEYSVLAGMLCLEAKELLSGLARTMYYEAVCRQHEAEVGAEATFFGIAANLHVEQRITDLRFDLKLAGIRRSTRRQRENRQDQRADETVRACNERATETDDVHMQLAELNCILQTANNLRVRLHQHEQFEAADECLRSISETEAKIVRLTLGVANQKDPNQSFSTHIGPWFRKYVAKLTNRPPVRQWFERTSPVRQRLSPLVTATGSYLRECGELLTYPFKHDACEKIPIWRVFCAAAYGINETVHVLTTRWKSKNRLVELRKRFGYLATGYFNYVTEYGTRISRLIEVNFAYVLVFWVIYFAFSGHIWSSENAPLTVLQQFWASGLNSIMLFVGGFAGIDDYIGVGPPMSLCYIAYLAICAIEVTVAYLHLGLLVALLYRKITREM